MSSGAIVLREQRDIVDGWISGYEQSFALAEQLCVTDFVPKDLRDKPGATLACILTGRELGIGPMASLRFVQMVEGSASLSAEYKRAAVLSAGHEFEIVEWTSTRCKVKGRRRGVRAWTEAAYSLDDARKANLMRPRGSWFTRPRRMLLARAGSDLCDAIFPDVTNGLPTYELMQEGQYVDGQLVEELEGGDATATPAGGAQDESDKPVKRARAPRGTGTRGSRAKKPVAAPPEDDAEEEIFDAEVVEDEPGEDGNAADEQAQADAEDAVDAAVAEAEAEDPFADGDEAVSGNAPAEAADLRQLGILFREAGLRSATEKVDLAKQVLGHAPGAEMTAMDAHDLIKILQLAIKKDNPKAALKKLAETAERDRLGEDGD